MDINSGQLVELASSIFDWVLEALKSNFSIALVSGFAGGYAGAAAAQHVIEKTKRREELTKEIRNTNAATMVAFSICNACLALKKQHVKPLYEQFQKDKRALEQHLEQRASGQVQGNAPYNFIADFNTFAAIEVPLESLKELIFHRISAYGRAVALVSVIEQSLVGTKNAILKREQFIQRVQIGAIAAADLLRYYFGHPLANGDTNREYPDLVEAIHSYLDDCAFFTALLCSDLVQHAKTVRQQFIEKVSKDAPSVHEPDFRGPRAQSLIPPDENYRDWLNAFITKGNDQ